MSAWLTFSLTFTDNEILKSEAKKAVIEDYSKFVSYIIKEKFYSYRKHWEDLFQCGVCGILKALENYDPHTSKPTTYFYYFIVQEIDDFITKYIKGTNRYYTRKIKQLNESISVLKESGVSNLSVHEIAKTMKIKEKSVRTLIKIKQFSQPISLDYLVEFGLLKNDQTNVEDIVERRFQLKALEYAILSLPQHEKNVIVRKFGLLGNEKMSNQEICEDTGIPLDKINSYLKSGLRKIRTNSVLLNWQKSYSKK